MQVLTLWFTWSFCSATRVRSHLSATGLLTASAIPEQDPIAILSFARYARGARKGPRSRVLWR